MFSKAATVFRVVALAEALSWAALLVAMFVKYVIGYGEGGVPTAGMIHGVLFLAYVAVTLGVFRSLGWSLRTLALGLAAGVPPLFTWWFESWALRTGRLDGARCQQRGGVGLLTHRQPALAST